MRWLCGLEIAPQGLGPLEVGAWLAEHGFGELEALTVVREPPIGGLTTTARSQLLTEVRALGERRIALSSASGLIRRFSVVSGPAPEDALCRQAEAMEMGLIVGRQTRTGSHALIRLGRVARRVLRRLPGPTCVAPPELRKDDLRSGPVVIGIEARADSLPAIEFGRRLATQAGRPPLFVHVVDPFPTGLGASAERGKELRQRASNRARASVEAFLTEHGVHGVDFRAVTGSVTNILLELARLEGACALVCGSRKLSTPERIFSASIGSHLGAAAPIPVFVIPPTPMEQ